MLSDFISLFFPNYCVACQESLSRNEAMICVACQHRMPKTKSHENRPNWIDTKFYGKVQLTHALAYYSFQREGLVQKVLHQLKYGNLPELGALIGELYGQELKTHQIQNNFDLIIPVPLHSSKLRRRGYNQSAAFGEGLAEAFDLAQEEHGLKRTQKTSTQTKKSRIERWQNVDRIFEVSNSELVKNKRVLLVDDVITTGSTVESCVHTLVEAECKSVGVAAIAAAK